MSFCLLSTAARFCALSPALVQGSSRALVQHFTAANPTPTPLHRVDHDRTNAPAAAAGELQRRESHDEEPRSAGKE